MMRRCLRCGAEITACMGFVLARDMLDAQDGLIYCTSVREHCGRCMLQIGQWTDEQRLSYLNSLGRQ